MHFLIVGGGIIGVSTAMALLKRGHSVSLFEARAGLWLETSFANGGMLTAGMCEPWNAPGVWKDLLKSFVDPKSPMKLHPGAIPGLAFWGLRFLAQSSIGRFTANTKASYALCRYSVEQTNQWVDEFGLDCDYRYETDASLPAGSLKIFPSRQAADFSLQLVEMLQPQGLRHEMLDREGVLAKEPALAGIARQIECGLYFPDDSAGDAHRFTGMLAASAKKLGLELHLDSEVKSLIVEQGKVRGVEVDHVGHKQAYRADAVILAAAKHSPALARQCGVKLPIKPAKGYSLTLDASHVDSDLVPKIAVINQAMHAAVNPLGQNVRVAGTAEFVRKPEDILSPERVENLMDLLTLTYPELAEQLDPEQGVAWCGFRPMSVDGKPFIGASSVSGLYVNSGHGYLGWTQAVGSAELLADQIDGKTTAIDTRPYAVGR